MSKGDKVFIKTHDGTWTKATITLVNGSLIETIDDHGTKRITPIREARKLD